jgi:hypothetical protein
MLILCSELWYYDQDFLVNIILRISLSGITYEYNVHDFSIDITALDDRMLDELERFLKEAIVVYVKY